MNKDNKKWLKQWETATQNLANEFTNKYFKDSASDIYWIGNEVGGILCVNDYFFDINRIYETIKYNASAKRLFEYYDKEIEFAMKEQSMPINFKTYLKTGVFNISKGSKGSNINDISKKDKKDKKEIKMEEK